MQFEYNLQIATLRTFTLQLVWLIKKWRPYDFSPDEPHYNKPEANRGHICETEPPRGIKHRRLENLPGRGISKLYYITSSKWRSGLISYLAPHRRCTRCHKIGFCLLICAQLLLSFATLFIVSHTNSLGKSYAAIAKQPENEKPLHFFHSSIILRKSRNR